MVTPLTFILNAFGYGAGLGIALISVITGSWLMSMIRDEFPTVYAVVMVIVGTIMGVLMILGILAELAHRKALSGRYKAHHRKITKTQRMLAKMHKAWKERKSTDDYDFFHDINVAQKAEPKPLW